MCNVQLSFSIALCVFTLVNKLDALHLLHYSFDTIHMLIILLFQAKFKGKKGGEAVHGAALVAYGLTLQVIRNVNGDAKLELESIQVDVRAEKVKRVEGVRVKDKAFPVRLVEKVGTAIGSIAETFRGFRNGSHQEEIVNVDSGGRGIIRIARSDSVCSNVSLAVRRSSGVVALDE